MASTPDKPPPKTFFDLAAELRNDIYEHALIQEDEIEVSRKLGLRHTEPNLLRTCRQIRDEARPIFYSRNAFRFTIPECAVQELSQIEPSILRHVESVRIGTPGYKTPCQQTWLLHVRAQLRIITRKLWTRGLERNAVFMPLLVEGDEEVTWVSCKNVTHFEAKLARVERKWVAVIRRKSQDTVA